MTRRNYQHIPEPKTQLDNKQTPITQDLLPPVNPAVKLVKRILSTVIVVGLFLFVCKITHFREKVLHDVRINRNFFRMFLFCVGVFIFMYLWMSIKSKCCRPKGQRIPVDDWDKVMPKQFYIAVAALPLSVFSFIGAMWRTFQLMTFPIGLLGLMTVIEVFSWIPSL